MTNKEKLLEARRLIYEVAKELYDVEPRYIIAFVQPKGIHFDVEGKDGLTYNVMAKGDENG